MTLDDIDTMRQDERRRARHVDYASAVFLAGCLGGAAIMYLTANIYTAVFAVTASYAVLFYALKAHHKAQHRMYAAMGVPHAAASPPLPRKK